VLSINRPFGARRLALREDASAPTRCLDQGDNDVRTPVQTDMVTRRPRRDAIDLARVRGRELVIATRVSGGAFAALGENTSHALAPLGVKDLGNPGEWACGDGRGGITRLITSRLQIGPANSPLAEGRVVRLHGPSTDGLLTFIYPANCEHLPALSAELLSVEGQPAMAWLDLRSPGLATEVAERVAEETTVLSIRHAPFLPHRETPPAHVMEYSQGGFLYTRCDDRQILPRLCQAYLDYLNAWIDFAFAAKPGGPTRSSNELAAFKKSGIVNTGCRPYLVQWFGEERGHRFLTDFLFQ
jgi:ferredoxin-dependent bilin reductase